MTTVDDDRAEAPRPNAMTIELNALNSIDESERRGTPRGLFWPWFAANVSVLGVSYGSFLLGFGISFWQATIVGILGIIVSFLFCGFISLAGKRGSAPTLTLSRAAFGVHGTALTAPRTAPSGGQFPTSIAVHDDLVYVLDAGGDGAVSGFPAVTLTVGDRLRGLAASPLTSEPLYGITSRSLLDLSGNSGTTPLPGPVSTLDYVG